MTTSTYQDFLARKAIIFENKGFDFERDELNPVLFDFQKDLTTYALRKGRAGIYADTGLGKTIMLSEWARIVNQRTGKNVLILAPLGVAKQTINLSYELLGNEIVYSRDGEPKGSVTITNYENLKKFNADDYIGLVADESSIFKSMTGKYKEYVFDMFKYTPYKLFCSATPAPNDEAELANQSEGLGILSRTDMQAKFFVHDGNIYRLKGHSEQHFYKWLASWGMHITKPSDLGYSDEGFVLPKMEVIPIFVESGQARDGLYFTQLKGIKDRSYVRKQTHKLRCKESAGLANSINEQWIMWCGLNAESELLSKLIPDSVEVSGSHSLEYKEDAFENFVKGNIRVLVTKPKIAGFGMNFQNSWHNCSVGLTDSWESFYQYVRRQYRFGQENVVKSFIVMSDAERDIYNNVLRKEEQAKHMSRELIKNVAQYEMSEIQNIREDKTYLPDVKFKLPKFLNGRI